LLQFADLFNRNRTTYRLQPPDALPELLRFVSAGLYSAPGPTIKIRGVENGTGDRTERDGKEEERKKAEKHCRNKFLVTALTPNHRTH